MLVPVRLSLFIMWNTEGDCLKNIMDTLFKIMKVRSGTVKITKNHHKYIINLVNTNHALYSKSSKAIRKLCVRNGKTLYLVLLVKKIILLSQMNQLITKLVWFSYKWNWFCSWIQLSGSVCLQNLEGKIISQKQLTFQSVSHPEQSYDFWRHTTHF